MESCDFAVRFRQLPPDHEFHHERQPHRQTQQPDQALHSALGLQKQRRQRQGLALEAPETPFNHLLPPIRQDHGPQGQFPLIGPIDPPPQALLGGCDGLRLNPRPNRAPALNSALWHPARQQFLHVPQPPEVTNQSLEHGDSLATVRQDFPKQAQGFRLIALSERVGQVKHTCRIEITDTGGDRIYHTDFGASFKEFVRQIETTMATHNQRLRGIPSFDLVGSPLAIRRF